MSELERLIKEKEELERKIMMLTEGKIIMDSVKLDMIKHNAAQEGRWAVSYKYRYIAEYGSQRKPKLSEKWVPMFYCENRETAIKMIPKAIHDLKDLYEKAVKKED